MALRLPPLGGVHEARGARMTEFGGWEMPVQFDGIGEEHTAVRERAGIFDVSHMGEVLVGGPDAVALTNRLTTNDVAALDPGEAQYTAVTDDRGVMLDDTIVYRLPVSHEAEVLFVPNAGHDAEMETRWREHAEAWNLEATVENATTDYAMVAVQGPDSDALVADALETRVADVGRFEGRFEPIPCTDDGTESGGPAEAWVSRTGFSGEDGFELIVPADAAEAVWDRFDCQPCGLGARDTLRLEMGYLLSGQDFHPENEPRTPFEAAVGFVVKLETEFVGRDALEAQDAEGVEERLVGFRLTERGVPRTGYAIESTDGEAIGTVTSGTMSPTLEVPIGLGYVPTAYADPGTRVRVIIRGEPRKARIETTPFLEDR